MGEQAHTPGPWQCEYGTDGYYAVFHKGDQELTQNVQANEWLIASAPDLLALLREALPYVRNEADNRAEAGSEMSDYASKPSDLADRIEAGIAQARGGE